MLDLPSSCVFPDGLDAAGFLRKYWQQSALLMAQAFPDFDTPLPADELAGLSLEPGTTPRLITKDAAGEFRLEYGPFEEDRFSTLGTRDWSLLVTDVEKHLPELRNILLAFAFLPSWRIDDVMVSYAPDGASVGAHVDDYDVFLLQASGERRWLIEDKVRDHVQSTQGDLRLVEDFSPSKDLILSPGDMLYLPPGIAHHGIAVGDNCTTWSIGFRAPAKDELVLKLSELIAQRITEAGNVERYRDPPLSPAINGEIDDAAIKQFKSLWSRATNFSANEFAHLVGTLLTQDGSINRHEQSADQSDESAAGAGTQLERHPFSELVWHGEGDTVTLYADGETYNCSRSLAIELCGMQSPTLINRLKPENKNDWDVVQQLLATGVLLA